jgi:hypothetical protein
MGIYAFEEIVGIWKNRKVVCLECLGENIVDVVTKDGFNQKDIIEVGHVEEGEHVFFCDTCEKIISNETICLQCQEAEEKALRKSKLQIH